MVNICNKDIMTKIDGIPANSLSYNNGEMERQSLLSEDQTLMNYNSFSSPIECNESLLTNHEPGEYYNLWKRRIYIISLVILVFSLFFGIGYVCLMIMIDSVNVSIGKIDILDINSSGAVVDFSEIKLSFDKKWVADWVQHFNGVRFEFSDNIKVSSLNGEEVIELKMIGKEFEFELIDSVWSFNVSNLSLEISENNFPKLVKDKASRQQLLVDSYVLIYGNVVPIHKCIKLDEAEYSNVIDGLIQHYVESIEILDYEFNKYDKTDGISGNLMFLTPELNDIPKLSATIGVYISEVFYELMEFSVQSLNDQRKNKLRCDFKIPNVDAEIIDAGIIDDLLWRIFNDDSNIEKFKVATRGSDVCSLTNYDIPLWFCNTWKELDMEILFSMNKFFQMSSVQSLGHEKNTTFFSIDNFSISSNNTINIISNIETKLNSIFDEFTIEQEGRIDVSGVSLNLKKLDIACFNKSSIGVAVQNADFDISDVYKSEKLLDYLVKGGDYDYYEDLKFMGNSKIKCDFFNGEINLEGKLPVNVKTMVNYLTDKVDDMPFEKEGISLVEVEYIGGDLNNVKFGVGILIYLPKFIGKVENRIQLINIGINHEGYELFELQIPSFESFQGIIPMKVLVSLNNKDIEKRLKIEKFVGEFISGVPNVVDLSGIEFEGEKSIWGCNSKICDVFESVEVPLNISSSDIKGGDGDEDFSGNYFIKDTTMHLMNKEVEMTLFNPIMNEVVELEILEAEAICEGYIIGYLKDRVRLVVGSGIWNSPRMKVEYANTGSAGWRILQRALREGGGVVENMTVRALVKVRMGGMDHWRGLNVFYESKGGMNGKVRW